MDGSESYRLGTGDKLRMIVFGEDDLGGEFQIDGNGRISLPLIGQIAAAGETAGSLEQTIAGRLAEYLQHPRVRVEISAYRPFYVIGEVNKPGEYAYVNGMSALNAIALAGGYTVRAQESRIYIRRNGSAKEEELPADQMTRIFPGDVVRIPESAFWTVMSVAGAIGRRGELALHRDPIAPPAQWLARNNVHAVFWPEGTLPPSLRWRLGRSVPPRGLNGAWTRVN